MNTVAVGSQRVGAGAPLLVIGGPCAIESRQLCMDVAGALAEACRNAGVGYVFKASFDKANRTAADAGRGLGMQEGLAVLAAVREEYQVPVITDIHLPEQAAEAGAVCDALQIPAFLCRQTDLVAAAAATGRPVQIKKGQFLAPEDMRAVVAKAQAAGSGGVLLCERGTTFGYHDLVVDMRGLRVMRELGWPVVFDATHSAQQPGALGTQTGGRREMAPVLARAACAAGVDGLFIEAHPRPDEAISDAAVQLTLPVACELIALAARIDLLVERGQA